MCRPCFFFFNDTATTEIYTLSLHDALPIFMPNRLRRYYEVAGRLPTANLHLVPPARLVVADALLSFLEEEQGVYSFADRKSTRLNSSHANISYAVFCLKKKKN